ncbi:iron-containing redox enzyme family protein [Mariniblastus sp.]|jgi:pyrroloquinoline quinone (PQQ) biosynthesis protein C|nr:iron-containing redox enzyme family protein [Mariniblastus sp.]MDB4671769.1 iron-containing redox enzyme family protein [Pirellulaceae bacterium]MDB4756431.1 iron-containing redox enzyme family protein [Mariniblastus sp.]
MIICQLTQVRDLTETALQHRAIHHPYLKALASGSLPNPQSAITDFAIQYQGYTSWFPRYLNCVMNKLADPQHREYFTENLNEEQGHLDEETVQQLEEMGIKESWVQGIPHPILFRRFQSALGINPQSQILCRAAMLWRQRFRFLLEKSTPAEAIGALGLGTEAMVKHIYRYITAGIESQTSLRRRDYVFFELHSEVDDEHAELMMRVAGDFAHQSPTNLDEIRRGMVAALDLRCRFWDQMLERAEGI